MSISKIGFIGLGLIGGSIAKKIKALHPEVELIATAGHLSTIETAFAQHLITNSDFLSMKDFSDCDYIFLCCPVQKNIEYLRELKGHLKDSCIVTDVGSVKSEIHQEVISLHMEEFFIGGHPMTGSEKTGLDSASEFLLENAYYIITPTSKTSPEALTRYHDFVASLGAIPMILDYEKHDFATAAISHLPHVIAYSLVNLVKNLDDSQETMRTIAAGGFKDLTRIASSSPIMWENICLSNRSQVLRLIDEYVSELSLLRSQIERSEGEEIISYFQTAKDYRDSLPISTSGAMKNVYELYLDLVDEAGGIAAIATILAEHQLSIKNIGIIHNREYEDGVLHLEMYDQASLDTAIVLLKQHHYTIYHS